MSIFKSLAAAAIGLSLITPTVLTPAAAHETTSGDLTIFHAAARPNLPNRPTAAYMVISNGGDTMEVLLSATSPSFETIELHTVEKDGDVMTMMPVETIEVPAGGSAVLEPGSFHLMLFGAEKPFKVGDSYPLVLTFENAGDVTVEVKVEKISAGSHGDHGGHGDHSKQGAKKDDDHGSHDHGTHNHGSQKDDSSND
ncbi:MAG: copper chaperone PCu(A)C [Pseudomonadota bacterium]